MLSSIKPENAKRVFSPRKEDMSLQFHLYPAEAENRISAGKRLDTESYIAAKYRQAHNALVTTFLPVLLTMNARGNPIAAVGINPGGAIQDANLPMYLEQYFDDTAEQKIASITKQPQARNQLVEIGNLVVTERGVGSLLFLVLAMALQRAGYKWMVFTATAEVEKIICRFGFEPCYVAEAIPARLSRHDEWGNYYDHQPRVLAGNLEQAFLLGETSPFLKANIERFDSAINEIADGLPFASKKAGGL